MVRFAAFQRAAKACSAAVQAWGGGALTLPGCERLAAKNNVCWNARSALLARSRSLPILFHLVRPPAGPPTRLGLLLHCCVLPLCLPLHLRPFSLRQQSLRLTIELCASVPSLQSWDLALHAIVSATARFPFRNGWQFRRQYGLIAGVALF